MTRAQAHRTTVRTPGGTVSAGLVLVLVLVAVDGRLGRVLPELADRVRTVRLRLGLDARRPPVWFADR